MKSEICMWDGDDHLDIKGPKSELVITCFVYKFYDCLVFWFLLLSLFGNHLQLATGTGAHISLRLVLSNNWIDLERIYYMEMQFCFTDGGMILKYVIFIFLILLSLEFPCYGQLSLILRLIFIRFNLFSDWGVQSIRWRVWKGESIIRITWCKLPGVWQYGSALPTQRERTSFCSRALQKLL